MANYSIVQSYQTLSPSFFSSLPSPPPSPIHLCEFSSHPSVLVILLRRPHRRNAVDGPTAEILHRTFVEFDSNPKWSVCVLHGEGTFCAGADLQSVGTPNSNSLLPPTSGPPSSWPQSLGPMGPSRLLLSKPVIASVEGHCVAGGLELALWCDIRICSQDAVFGVFCRRWGVPLIDGGTIRLARAIGQSRAMDMVLTGRPVGAKEAFDIGLVNRVTDKGGIDVLQCSLEYSSLLCRYPFECLKADRLSLYRQWDFPSLTEALQFEFINATSNATVMKSINSGASKFAKGAGRRGNFEDFADGKTASTAPKVVIFDLGGVVFPSPVEYLVQYENRKGLPRFALNRALMLSPTWKALECGHIGAKEFVAKFEDEVQKSDELRGKVDVEEVFSEMNKGLSHPRSEFLHCIRSLRKEGFVVAALTNNWKMRAEDTDGANMIMAHTIFPELLFQSCVMGVRKPDKQIFVEVVKRIESKVCEGRTIPTDRICFVDDIPQNLKTAKEMGIHTIRVTREYSKALEDINKWKDIVGSTGRTSNVSKL